MCSDAEIIDVLINSPQAEEFQNLPQDVYAEP
jgi:hypothetical protein